MTNEEIAWEAIRSMRFLDHDRMVRGPVKFSAHAQGWKENPFTATAYAKEVIEGEFRVVTK